MLGVLRVLETKLRFQTVLERFIGISASKRLTAQNATGSIYALCLTQM